MPALQRYIIEPIWEQFAALLPDRKTDHPLGCHRPRIPDRVVFEELVQILVFGCAYWRIADEGCSAATLRRRRDEWMEAGLMDAPEEISARDLRPGHRPAAGRRGRRLLHHQGSAWRREGG